jgi:hypothetical protein
MCGGYFGFLVIFLGGLRGGVGGFPHVGGFFVKNVLTLL